MSNQNKTVLRVFNNEKGLYEEVELIGDGIRFYIDENNYIDISGDSNVLFIRGIQQLSIKPVAANTIFIEHKGVF